MPLDHVIDSSAVGRVRECGRLGRIRRSDEARHHLTRKKGHSTSGQGDAGGDIQGKKEMEYEEEGKKWKRN